MLSRFCRKSPLWWRRACIVLLALFWCVGLFFGIYTACSFNDAFVPLMRAAVQCRVSIVGLLLILFLPFLFAAFAVYFSQPWLLLVIGFVKAFSFGFCCFAAQSCFGSAGWLVRLLLLFSDSCMLPVLCWFCVRHISGDLMAIRKDLILALALAIVVGSIDYYWVSPFLAALIDF